MAPSSDTIEKEASISDTSRSAGPGSALISLAIISRIHIVAIAAAAALTFGWMFTGTYVWLGVAVCALDWYIVNLVNQTVDFKEDSLNRIAKADFTNRHRRAVLVGSIAFTLASLPAVYWINPLLTLPRLAFHTLGAFYNWPLLPGGLRLKHLYFWKNSASALGFVITVFGYPLAAVWPGQLLPDFPAGTSLAALIFAVVFFFLFEVSYEIIYDIRDVAGDAAAGVRTYAVVHGVKGALHIIDALIWVSAAVLLLGYALGVVPWRLVIMAAAPLVQWVFYKRALNRGLTAKDCVLLTWTGVGLLVFYNLWVVAKLPGSGL